jgi:hypothetical protein
VSIVRCRCVAVAISVLLVVPCLWHRRIEAGDLPSHAYNAWLAQLVEKGQAPGLYLTTRWDNVLFDVTLARAASVIGFAAAQKLLVSLCVLIFFWGVFALVSAVAGRPPWLLAPAVAMIAYGYVFNMGFVNYYLSTGLASFALAAAWRGGARRWILALALAPLVLLAHPVGFLWLAGTLAYRAVRGRLPGWWKAAVPAAAVVAFLALHEYLVHLAKFEVGWNAPPVYLRTGADQLMLYGFRYEVLGWTAFGFGCACFVAGLIARRHDRAALRNLVAPLELYAVSFVALLLLPENLRFDPSAGWVGLLVSRLTVVAAIWGICALACLVRPSPTSRAPAMHLLARAWQGAGFAALAAVFFGFLYQDTAWLNRLEANVESVLAPLPLGTRIIPLIDAEPGWRVEFIGHVADRACIGRCFTYSNYEAPSRQFRLRVSAQGSPIVTASEEDSGDMETGNYTVRPSDPPLVLLYQCDDNDDTKVCLHPLAVGESTGQFDQ